MRWFNDLSMRVKLLAVILSVTLTALIVMAVAFVADDIQTFRLHLHDSTVATAATIGNYSVTDLTFGDRKAAETTLDKLKRNENVINASLYDNRGKLFASYLPGDLSTLTPTPVRSLATFRDDLLEVIEPIFYEGTYYGAVKLQVKMVEFEQQIQNHLFVMLLTVAAILLLSYFLASYLQRLISRPIVELTTLARKIEQEGDFSVRLDVVSKDEIGILAHQFNAVMQQVMRREVDRDEALGSLKDSEERVRLLLDSTAEAIYGADEAGHCIFANPACLRLFGFDETDASLEAIMMPLLLNDSEQISRNDTQASDVQLGMHSDSLVLRRSDGSSFPAEYWAYPVYQRGSFKGTVVTCLDISERRAAEATQHLLQRAMEQTADAVMITDQNGCIEFVNPAYERISGYTADELIGKTPSIVQSGIHDEAFYEGMWETLRKGEIFRETFMNRHKSGELIYQQQTITPLKDDSGNITRFISTSQDISSEIETQQRLHTMAYHDALTGLPNRELFRDRLEHAIAKANRDRTLVPIMFIDLDHFKNINDTLGHPVGDRLLQQVAECIRESVREADTVARLGGDEFTVLLEGLDGVDAIASRAARLMQAFSKTFLVDEHEVFVTASIGVAIYPKDVRSIDDLFRAADTAMYRAKADGRNNFQFFTTDMAAQVLRRVTLEKDLRHAMYNDEFCLYYQPRVAMDGRSTNSVEALIRWHHPREGVVSPDAFIPVLEESGMIVEVGEWVCKTAFSQLAVWRRSGLDIIMAVNVSPRQFVATSLVDNILEYLKTFDLQANHVELEITEAVLMDYTDRTSGMFDAIRQSGLRLAIDDFGTGFSSLSYLRRLPIHTLKIDRSFVEDMLTDPEDAVIVEAIISLAKSLKLNLTAEGVETKAQLAYLAAAGCDEAQGYLISRPLPAAEATAWLLDQLSATSGRGSH